MASLEIQKRVKNKIGVPHGQFLDRCDGTSISFFSPRDASRLGSRDTSRVFETCRFFSLPEPALIMKSLAEIVLQ